MCLWKAGGDPIWVSGLTEGESHGADKRSALVNLSGTETEGAPGDPYRDRWRLSIS